MPFIQLKPIEDSFIEVSRNLTKRLRGVVLCEGVTDTEILKLVVEEPDLNIGVTDCGGVKKLYEVARYMAALARYSRRLSSIGVIIDADEYTYSERAEALIDSLRSHGVRVNEFREISEGLFEALVERKNLLICVTGLNEIPVEKHAIEDHVVKALILNGRISVNHVKGRHRSKNLLSDLNIDVASELKTLMREKPEIVKKSFERFLILIDKLYRVTST